MSQKLTFEEAVAKLGEFQSRGWRLGLDRMQEFLHRLGLDDKLGDPSGPQFIHVAGTNGKGSACAFLQSILHEHGYNVGTTFSPYVYDVRERVQLGRDLISEEDFARLTETLLKVGATLEETEFGGPTEFEMKTALGFLYWAEKQCDYVALEVGLGGRLDATNVVDPACSVIVSVGLDHTAILGNTLELIAREKAGIIKPNKPVVIGDLPEGAAKAVESIASQNDSEIIKYGRDFAWRSGTVKTKLNEYSDLTPGIKGTLQGHNLAVAIAALEAAGIELDPATIRNGAMKSTLPGRFEVRHYKGRTFVLDGAHNPQAAQALVETLRSEGSYKPMPLITARLEGHETAPFYSPLEPLIASAYVTKVDFHRAMDPQRVIEEAAPALKGARSFANVRDALDACLEETNEGDTILVTGSFYLVGEVGNLMTRGSSPE